MKRGQLDDRWKEIRGKVALIFHLLITTKALPPPLAPHSHTHPNTCRRVHVNVHTNSPVLESISSQPETNRKNSPNSTTPILLPLPAFLYFSPLLLPLNPPTPLQPGLLTLPLPSTLTPTHPVLLPSSTAASQKSREQSLGGSVRLN